MKRVIGMAAAILLAGALVAPAAHAVSEPAAGAGPRAAPASLTLPAARVDNDHDGIDDNLEQYLANQYAPVIYMPIVEPNYPVNVDWFLRYGSLEYDEAIWPMDRTISAVPGADSPLVSQEELIGPPWVHGSQYYGNVSTTDPTVQTGPQNVDTFVIPDLAENLRVGSLNSRDWTTYVHEFPNILGGVTIQYWHLFAFNSGWNGFGDHGGDWDASISVVLGGDLTPNGAYYLRHNHDGPGDWWPWPGPNDQQGSSMGALSPFETGFLRVYQGTHPIVTLDQGGHGSFVDPGDVHWYYNWNIPNYGVYDATFAWSDDPADLTSGTVWETWEGGQVQQRGYDELPPMLQGVVPRVTSGPSGQIVNLGEYNPSPPVYPTALGAGTDSILNDQVFVEYTGLWGSVDSGMFDVSSGPQGPVTHAWYWQADPAAAQVDPACILGFNWCAAPKTSLGLGEPKLGLGGLSLVRSGSLCGESCAGDQTFTLTPTQNEIAAQYGQSHTYFRVYRAGDPAPTFNSYYDPFALPSAAGQYTLDYYTLDALNNMEDYQTETFEVSTLTSLAVTPASPTAAAGRTQQFTATGTYSKGAVFDLTSSVKWASSTPGVATIRASGLARGVSPGASTISAALGSVTGSTVLTVGPAEPLSVSLADTVAAGSTIPVTLTFANVPAADLGHLRAWITCGVPSDQAPAPCGPPVGFTGVPGSTTVTGDTITFANQTQNPDGSYSGSGTAMLIVTPTYTGPAYVTFTDEASGIPVGTNIAEFTIAAVSETLSVSATGALAISALATGTTNPVNLTFAHVPAAGIGALNLTLVCGTPTGPLCGQYRGVPGSTTVNGITITFANKTQNPDGTYSGSGTVMYTTAQELTGTAFAKFVDGATGAEAWDPFTTSTTSETLSVSIAPTVTVRGEFPVTLTFADVPAADIGHLQVWTICGIPTGPTPCGGYRGVPGDTTVTGDTITFANQTQNYDGSYSGGGTVMYHAPTTYLGPSYMTFFDMTTGDPVAANSADFTIAAVKNQTITFTNPGNKRMTASPLTVSATASSGLPVTLSSTTLPVCTASGLTITFVGPGSCTIVASQAGDANYNAAPSVTRTFQISKVNQTITFTSPGNQKMAASPLTVNATASSGLPVTLTSSTTSVCTVIGMTITFVAPGFCTIVASQAGDANYNAAPSVTRSFRIQ